jgi:hypothetical protein
VLSKAVEAWETDNLELASLRDRKDVEFEQRTQDLLSTVDRAVCTYIEATDFTPIIRAAFVYEEANPGVSKQKMLAIAGLGRS